MERQILHIDVNNAFLSWTAVEMLKNGNKLDIRTIPSIIGGDEERRKGIVLAKSMKAKEFGIVTAETIYQAKEINKRVREELGFTVNIGVAHNKLLAKMASDFTKPDKIHTLFENEIETKMWKLPISELFMLGRKSAFSISRTCNLSFKKI